MRASIGHFFATHTERAGLSESAGAAIVLARNEMLSTLVGGRPCRILCLAGQLWITVDGSQDDYVLGPGEAVTFSGGGRLVVQALRIATVRLERPLEARAGFTLRLASQPA